MSVSVGSVEDRASPLALIPSATNAKSMIAANVDSTEGQGSGRGAHRAHFIASGLFGASRAS
jgi:hypothetical protein